MDVATTVRISDDEIAPLCAALGCNADQLSDRLANVGRAALREYVEMLLGDNVLRSPENRERRLLTWIMDGNDGIIPDEAQVSMMFNITTSSARSLLRAVMSRYRKQMAEATERAAKKVLQQCGEQDGAGLRRVSVGNPVLVEYLNGRLAQANGGFERIRLEAKTSNTYIFQGDAFNKLSEILPWQA